MAAIDRGEQKSHVSRMFNISRDTIDRWLKQRDQTGTAQAASDYQKGHSHRMRDWDKFRAFAQAHGDRTQAKMAQLWNGDISGRTISRSLARIGLSRKKRLMVIKNETKPTEPRF